MIFYVIERLDQGGGFLAHPGYMLSFTHIGSARRFATREAAEAELCPENEVVREIVP